MDDALLAVAAAARAHAYAPYSRFLVGAAVRAASGTLYCGVNVENAAYPVGTCAEAGAVAAMVAAGERRIIAVAIVGSGTTPVVPCGACRQRLWEFGHPDTPVFCAGSDGTARRFSLGGLLPDAFGPDTLDTTR